MFFSQDLHVTQRKGSCCKVGEFSYSAFVYNLTTKASIHVDPFYFYSALNKTRGEHSIGHSKREA
jgi:hypothetical protein